jgi:AAA+ superfamily predicted ATPase
MSHLLSDSEHGMMTGAVEEMKSHADAAQRETPAAETPQPYRDSAEYLSNLMTRLDLRIRREILLHRQSRKKTDSWTAFVSISDAEVDALLGHGMGNKEIPEATMETSRTTHQIARLDSLIHQRVLVTLKSGTFLSFLELARIFGLSGEETDVLLVCLAPEIDPRYERLYGYLHDDMTRKRPSVGLTLAICRGARFDAITLRAILSPRAPLVRYRLVHIVDDPGDRSPFMSRALKLDDRIASYLLGEPGLDPRLQDMAEWMTPAPESTEPTRARENLVERLLGAIGSCFRETNLRRKPLLYLHGKPGTGKGTAAGAVCSRLHLPVLVMDAEQLRVSAIGFDEGVFLALRESLLCKAALYLQHMDQVLENDPSRLRLKALVRNVEEMGGITFLTGERPWSWSLPGKGVFFLPVEIHYPGYGEQMDLWRRALAGQSDLSEGDFSVLASKYPWTDGQIQEVVQGARNLAVLRTGRDSLTMADVDRSCRTHRVPDLGGLAQKIEPVHTWQDLVLPSDQMDRLRDICNQVLHRAAVYGTWGFGRKLSLGKGLHALFSGPPGTGKTMAAEVLANELRIDLYKIDLSQVVSKYIGETEKNLHHIFREAQRAQVILFFDEADALLGKRSDVKDAHDRYANLEIAYLLQKMEEYEGITILATNFRQNMDEAFVRRIRFIIEFPFPEEQYRLRIWQGIWPEETPLSGSVDLPFMATRFKLAGGSIRNIALAAAFLASSNGNTIDMKHLLNATRREFQKMGRLITEDEFSSDEQGNVRHV